MDIQMAANLDDTRQLCYGSCKPTVFASILQNVYTGSNETCALAEVQPSNHWVTLLTQRYTDFHRKLFPALLGENSVLELVFRMKLTIFGCHPFLMIDLLCRIPDLYGSDGFAISKKQSKFYKAQAPRGRTALTNTESNGEVKYSWETCMKDRLGQESTNLWANCWLLLA